MRRRRQVRARTRARASAASASAAGCASGRRSSQRPQKVEAFGRWPAFSTPTIARRRAPRPSVPDRPSHRRGRRPRDRPGNGSCRRRSGCSAASPGTRCRASRSGRCRGSRRDTRPARRDRRPARAGREGRVDRHVLAGRRAREHAQDCRHVLQRRHDLLDRGDDDVDARQDLRQVAVALVGDDDRGAGLGDQEIGAGDADIGGEEAVAQDAARLGEQRWSARRGRGRPAGACGRGGNPPRPAPWCRCTAGAMMWLGASSRSWMMYSPRSVSTGSMPFCLEDAR